VTRARARSAADGSSTHRPVRTTRIGAGFVVLALAAGSLSFAIAATAFKPPAWLAGTAPVAADLRGVALDDASGYAVGVGGAILKTTDGGATWSSLRSETKATLNAVDFSSKGTGWAVGDSGTVLASSDGAGWSAQHSGTATDLLAVSALDARRAWAVGRGGTIIATFDGGSSWTQRSAVGRDATALRGVAFADDRRGWAWGDGGTVARTTDCGSTWTTAAVAPTGTTLYAGAFVDKETGWVAGSGGVVKKTDDGGATWTTQTVETTATIFGITFLDDEWGFLVGGDSTSTAGLIAGTADGGVTWTVQKPVTLGVYRGVRFADEHTGLIVGDGGAVLRTAPAGSTTPTPDSSGTVAPVGIYARTMRSGEVLVGWGESASSARPVAYHVWRSIDGALYDSLATVRGEDGPHLVDTSAPESRTIRYKVSTLGPTGESSACAPASVETKERQAPKPRAGTMTCVCCHPPHGASANELYPADYGICLECHDEIDERLSGEDSHSRHDLLHADQSAHGSRLSCANCHNPHALSKRTPIADPVDPGPRGGMPHVTVEFCLDCHGRSLPTPARTDPPRGEHGAKVAGDIAATWPSDVHGGGISASDPHLRPEMGYVTGDTLACVSCHDAHGSTNRWTLLESVPSKDGTRHASALLVRPVGDGGDLRLFCSGCHVLSAHPTVAQGGADLSQWPIDCTACHRHGAGL
jgi:predicted CXXCH cytochrome family protein